MELSYNLINVDAANSVSSTFQSAGAIIEDLLPLILPIAGALFAAIILSIILRSFFRHN